MRNVSTWDPIGYLSLKATFRINRKELFLINLSHGDSPNTPSAVNQGTSPNTPSAVNHGAVLRHDKTLTVQFCLA